MASNIVLIVIAESGYQVIKRQRQRRRRGLARADATRDIHIAPRRVGQHLIEKQVDLIAGCVVARGVERTDGDVGAAKPFGQNPL